VLILHAVAAEAALLHCSFVSSWFRTLLLVSHRTKVN
jgi:hypothetical protein